MNKKVWGARYKGQNKAIAPDLGFMDSHGVPQKDFLAVKGLGHGCARLQQLSNICVNIYQSPPPHCFFYLLCFDTFFFFLVSYSHPRFVANSLVLLQTSHTHTHTHTSMLRQDYGARRLRICRWDEQNNTHLIRDDSAQQKQEHTIISV